MGYIAYSSLRCEDRLVRCPKQRLMALDLQQDLDQPAADRPDVLKMDTHTHTHAHRPDSDWERNRGLTEGQRDRQTANTCARRRRQRQRLRLRPKIDDDQ